ncbi:hypothetical protein [Tautonia plasticadhaerens]|uniref:hypothetical protein n=1 Tax=Tautonia plasticadhaerens TaxID=2527974 RepID=UPI0011A96ED9|nr:hypothetical protein [Tautonia plasticadhaerens]
MIDLMFVVAICGVLFGAHRALSGSLGDAPSAKLASTATGMLIFLTATLGVLEVLRRRPRRRFTVQSRRRRRGLDEASDCVVTMVLAIGLPAGVFSWFASPMAGALYLGGTAAILAAYWLRRR